jgi:hypothetical protein
MKDHLFSFSFFRKSVARKDFVPEQHSSFDDTEVGIVFYCRAEA